MRSISLFILLLGFFAIIVGYLKKYRKCPEPKIEYRYIPKTFYEEQLTVPNLRDKFKDMFDHGSTWQNYPLNTSSLNNKKNNDIYNNFFKINK